MKPYVLYSLIAALAIATSLIVNKIILRNTKLSTLQYAFLFHAGGWIGAFFLSESFAEETPPTIRIL